MVISLPSSFAVVVGHDAAKVPSVHVTSVTVWNDDISTPLPANDEYKLLDELVTPVINDVATLCTDARVPVESDDIDIVILPDVVAIGTNNDAISDDNDDNEANDVDEVEMDVVMMITKRDASIPSNDANKAWNIAYYCVYY